MARKRELPTGMVERPGRGGYWADFRSNGRRVQCKLSNDFKAARKILNQLKSRADQVEFGLLDNDCSVSELRNAYMRNVAQTLKEKTIERYEHSLDVVLPSLAANRVSQIDTNSVLQFREDRLAAGLSPRTVNHDVTILVAMLNWGVQHKLIGSNQIKGLKRLRHDNPKERRPLTVEEAKKLLEVSQEPWKSIWYCFLVTGLRFGDLQAIEFRDLDWNNREIIARAKNAKNSRERRIPMDDDLYSILRRLQDGCKGRQSGSHVNSMLDQKIKARFTRDRVFVTTQNTVLRHRNLLRTYMACCKKVGIETRTVGQDGREIDHVDLHSLRVTFATEAIASGSDPKSVQEILGHRTLDMTMRIYAKMRGATKRRTISRLRYGAGSHPPDHLLELPA